MTQIEIRPGEGGEDAVVFADQLAEAVLRYARGGDPEAFLANRIIETSEPD